MQKRKKISCSGCGEVVRVSDKHVCVASLKIKMEDAEDILKTQKANYKYLYDEYTDYRSEFENCELDSLHRNNFKAVFKLS